MLLVSSKVPPTLVVSGKTTLYVGGQSKTALRLEVSREAPVHWRSLKMYICMLLFVYNRYGLPYISGHCCLLEKSPFTFASQ